MSLIESQSLSLDVISMCVCCREDGTTLLKIRPDDNLLQFPFSIISKSSWRLTVRNLISTIKGLSGKEISIMRITKFWVPETTPVFHIVYKLKCPLSEKKGLNLEGGNLKWFTLDQVQNMCLTSQLHSPELIEYVYQTLKPLSFYPITTDPEASKEGFDMLYEVVEKDVIIEINSSFLTPQEKLLKMANFTKNEQKKLYKEFLLRTFPNLLMNKIQFENFCEELGWKKEKWPGLFICADVSARGGMTFRDFLLFLAATEPDTPHGEGSAEIRCQYIFRYFDQNRDNVLDQSELRALIVAILSVKGNVKPSDVDMLVESYVQNLGLGSKIRLSMRHFLKNVGELKFRGTSSIFRSAVSVLKHVTDISSIKRQNSVVQSSPKKSSVFSGRLARRGVSTFTMSSSPVNNVAKFMEVTTKNKGFEIATHAVRLTRSGLVEDVQPIDRVSHGKSLSLGNQDLFTRLPSIQYYDENTSTNQLLSALKHFTNEIPKTKISAFKQAYSWGKYNMQHLMSILLQVCDKCLKIIEKEPRMLQLTSPIYILGDLHGNYPDLMAFEEVLWSLGIGLTPCSLLFLGDYVDRGVFGVELVCYLFAQKVKNPNKIFLLRGNHEIRSVQKAFTFYLECQCKFGEENFFEVWNMINRVFDVMPLAAIIDKKLFCCHGGIPPPWLCAHIDVINSIPCPLITPEEDSVLAWEIMWNDPVKTEQITMAVAHEMEVNEGFAINFSRKTGRVFSLDALNTFLKRNDLSHVIRAHEVKTAGFQVQQGGKLLTVFSSSGYCGGPNEAACIFVSQDKIRIFRIDTS